MASYLLDTNVALRFLDATDAANRLTLAAVAELIRRGDEPEITPQVLIETWAVATRPKASNGSGWSLDRVRTGVDDPQARFQKLDDISQIFPTWLRLLINSGAQGKQVHDARLVAVVLAHGNSHIVTFNVTDFERYPGIIPIHPQR